MDSQHKCINWRVASLLIIAVLTAGGALVAVSAAKTDAPPSSAHAVNADKTGLAIGGYDPVTYFTAGEPRKGDFQITHEYKGAVYRFVNESNRDRFRKSPAQYAPQYGGYCAYGVAVDKKFSSDPTVWKIVDGKLYLNLDRNIAKLFNEDVPGHIDKADRNWKTLADEPAR